MLISAWNVGGALGRFVDRETQRGGTRWSGAGVGFTGVNGWDTHAGIMELRLSALGTADEPAGASAGWSDCRRNSAYLFLSLDGHWQ